MVPLCIKADWAGDLRRLALDRDSLNFSILTSSLRIIFPNAFPWTLRYTDEDDDSIAITSDLELAAALLPNPNPLRLTVVPEPENIDEDRTAKRQRVEETEVILAKVPCAVVDKKEDPKDEVVAVSNLASLAAAPLSSDSTLLRGVVLKPTPLAVREESGASEKEKSSEAAEELLQTSAIPQPPRPLQDTLLSVPKDVRSEPPAPDSQSYRPNCSEPAPESSISPPDLSSSAFSPSRHILSKPRPSAVALRPPSAHRPEDRRHSLPPATYFNDKVRRISWEALVELARRRRFPLYVSEFASFIRTKDPSWTLQNSSFRSFSAVLKVFERENRIRMERSGNKSALFIVDMREGGKWRLRDGR